MKLQIIQDFDSFSVIEKQSGVLSTPGSDPTVPNLVKMFRNTFPGVISHPTVHRLDMDTSGIILLAKNQRSQRNLSVQFIEHKVQKRYEALLDGNVRGESGLIELAFSLDFDNKPAQKYDPENGKVGITKWKKLSYSNGTTRVSFWPITGRTHQLRLHSSHSLGLGYPILGDRLYGSGTAPGQLKLHAAEITFFHPETGEEHHFFSPPPF